MYGSFLIHQEKCYQYSRYAFENVNDSVNLS